MTAAPRLRTSGRPSGLARLLNSASLELGANRPQDVDAIAAKLPQGTRVFVSHLPRHALGQSLLTARRIQDSGLSAIPHIAARRVAARDELAAFLRGGPDGFRIRRALLIGGDLDEPAGPYADAEAVLADPALAAAGLEEIYFAVYPEAHPRISDEALEQALRRKIARAEAMGLCVNLITQLCFAPDRIIACMDRLTARYPKVAVHIGFAGPTSLTSLARYAQTCGVAASFGSLMRMGGGGFKLATSSDPLRELEPVAARLEALDAPTIRRAHFFAFGGAVATADWIAGQATRNQLRRDVLRPAQ